MNFYTRKYSLNAKESNKEEIKGHKQMKHLESKNTVADINSATSMIILNINGLNNLIKRQRLSDWIKIRSKYMLSTENIL